MVPILYLKCWNYPEQTGGRMERRIKSLWIENQRGSTYNSSMGSYVYPTSYEEAGKWRDK